MIKKFTYLLALAVLTLSCEEDDKNELAPVDERKEEAIENLREELVRPDHGWRLLYQPTDFTGSYFLLLSFDEDGEVRVQSDVVGEDGEFYDQLIPYRIDAELGLELIFETYGVFHYFFEQQQATFGGEFEFVFVEEDGEDLIFESKSDFGEKTRIVLEPAGPGEQSLFSRELSKSLTTSLFQSPFLSTTAYFQLILEAEDISVFFTLDNEYRLIKANYAAVGTSIEEVVSGSQRVPLDYASSYLLQNGAIQLQEPLSFSLNGRQFSFSEITLGNFQKTQTTFCAGNPLETHQLTGEIPGLGSVTMKTSLLAGDTGFGAIDFFSSPVQYLIDDADESLIEGILEDFPGAAAFQLYNGLDIGDDETLDAVGLVLVDELNNVHFLLREFETLQAEGNRLSVALSDSTFERGDFTDADRQNLFELTDLLFAGGQVYALNFPFRDDLYELYNPCNDHKMLLFAN